MDTDPLPSPLGIILAALGQQPFGLDSIIALSIAIVLLFVSGFISGSEISFFSITDAQLDEMDEDDPKGSALRKLLDKPEKLLATILIGNNLVNVAIVVLTNFALGPVFENMPEVLSFILQSVILTFVILLFGEILPKLYATSNAMGWARFSLPGVRFLSTIFSPLSSLLVGSTLIVNKVVTKKASISTDELSQALDITDVKGTDDKQMLQGILKFGDTTASEIMTPRVSVVGIDNDATFDEVMQVVLDKGYSRMPVYKDTMDNLIGVLYSRDLLPYIGKAKADFDWHKLLRNAYYVPESRMIDDLLEDFRKLKIHMAIVVDEYGGTQGVVTLEDVLEEIVGDINDEYDEEDKLYQRVAPDTYNFEGRTPLTDFFRITGLEEEEYAQVAEDAETIAGMLLAIKGDFPKNRETLEYGRCRFTIINMADHRIKQVKVTIKPEQ